MPQEELQSQADKEMVVTIHDSDLLEIITSYSEQINGCQALLKRLRIMLRMSKGNINHWHWASQQTWVEWCGIKLTQFKRLDAIWLEQGWFEKVERPGKTTHIKLGKIFDALRSRPQNVANTWPQNVANTWPQNVANTWPQNVATNSQYLNSQKVKSNKLNVCGGGEETHNEWVSNYSPETIVNRLADLGCLKMGGKGFIENVTFWNEEARTALKGLDTGQLKEFIVFTKQSLGRRKLELSEGILSNLVTSWRSEENKPISAEPEYVEQEEHYEVRDDMPF
jgi:hypothetical protein